MSQNGDTVYRSVINYEFNPDNTVSKRLTISNFIGNAIQYDTSFLLYANNKCYKDSTLTKQNSTRSVSVTSYTYESNKFKSSLIKTNLQTQFKEFTNLASVYTISNNNMLNQFDTIVFYNSVGGILNSSSVTNEYLSTYSTVLNPSARFSTSLVGTNFIALNSGASGYISQNMQSKLVINYGFGAGNVDTYTYNYTLRTDGYPKEGRIINTYNNNNTTTRKTIYRYK
jgi:hypothetical protein